MKISALQRFEKRYIPVTETGCWLWLASVNNSGYGAFCLLGITNAAHRASWVLFKGPIPNGKHVLHRCDVRCCVNPDHLFLGSMVDNSRDMMKKGRGRYVAHLGESNGRARLDEQKVLEIRQLAAEHLHSERKLAVTFDVSRWTIRNIVNKRRWKHLAEQPEKYQVRQEGTR